MVLHRILSCIMTLRISRHSLLFCSSDTLAGLFVGSLSVDQILNVASLQSVKSGSWLFLCTTIWWEEEAGKQGKVKVMWDLQTGFFKAAFYLTSSSFLNQTVLKFINLLSISKTGRWFGCAYLKCLFTQHFRTHNFLFYSEWRLPLAWNTCSQIILQRRSLTDL